VANPGDTAHGNIYNHSPIQEASETECLLDSRTELEDHLKIWSNSLACNDCERMISEHYFHCNICDSSDFDLCLGCFRKGKHCLDKDHWVMECGIAVPTGEERYYSGVKENGQRDEIDLSCH